MSPRIRRLHIGDAPLALRTLALMAAVFDEAHDQISEPYVLALLRRPDFWLLAATDDGEPVGGLTAHALPMTRAEATELLIYDLAVQESRQREGIGRALVTTLRELAAAEGIRVSWVPADNDDAHALDFYRALNGEPAAVTIFTFE